jgi:hypothetical protein
MKEFIQRTFTQKDKASGSTEQITKNRKSKKKRQGTTELRLKTKVPEEEIVR